MNPTSFPFRIHVALGIVADIKVGSVVFGQEIVKISRVQVTGDMVTIDAWAAVEGAGDLGGSEELPMEIPQGEPCSGA